MEYIFILCSFFETKIKILKKHSSIIKRIIKTMLVPKIHENDNRKKIEDFEIIKIIIDL